MEKNPDIIYPDDYLDIFVRVKEAGAGYIDLAEMILFGRTFTGMNITQERYDEYYNEGKGINIENPPEEAYYEISDGVDIHFTGTASQCGSWLFKHYFLRGGEFGIELVAEPEEPEFQLPEHCRKQMIAWKTTSEIRKLIKKHNTGAEYGHRIIMQSLKKP